MKNVYFTCYLLISPKHTNTYKQHNSRVATLVS
jgi:hypothetical protein